MGSELCIRDRVRAPPPPLINCFEWLASSAPSMLISRVGAAFKSITFIPPFSSRSVDAVLEDTAQSNLCLIFISSSMKKFTVLPVPIPRIVSFVNLDSICSIVASATLLFK